jgi:hypothetical protein
MKTCIAVALVLMMSACGSTYTLKEGGWRLEKTDKKGTCLTVHGDGDPEVVVVCIAHPAPIKLPRSVVQAVCPTPPPAESTDGTE